MYRYDPGLGGGAAARRQSGADERPRGGGARQAHVGAGRRRQRAAHQAVGSLGCGLGDVGGRGACRGQGWIPPSQFAWVPVSVDALSLSFSPYGLCTDTSRVFLPYKLDGDS
jgi:hypothetical protein